MGSQSQHRHNSGLEKRWVADAARDAADLNRDAQREASHGHMVESRFLAEEAKNAGSWVGKRHHILEREERLAGKR